MNCMNCGAFLADKDLDYCPHCGCNVLIQQKGGVSIQTLLQSGLGEGKYPGPFRSR